MYEPSYSISLLQDMLTHTLFPPDPDLLGVFIRLLTVITTDFGLAVFSRA